MIQHYLFKDIKRLLNQRGQKWLNFSRGKNFSSQTITSLFPLGYMQILRDWQCEIFPDDCGKEKPAEILMVLWGCRHVIKGLRDLKYTTHQDNMPVSKAVRTSDRKVKQNTSDIQSSIFFFIDECYQRKNEQTWNLCQKPLKIREMFSTLS